MSQPQIDSSNADRRSQILEAALVCFAKRGFHQTSMHDISGEAGISVGLIYRYFENKEAVISAMAARHKEEIQQMLERARQAPSLLESLEILFTAHCCENEPRLISAFVVEKATPGLSVSKTEDKLGIRASDTAELVFDGCRVPAGNRIGEEGKGFHIALATLDGGRIGIAAQAVGIAAGAYERSVAYARERKAFGVPIGQHQMVQWMLADMATAIDGARLMTLKAATLKDAGRPYTKEASMAKLFAAETAMKVATDAVQVHGGYGYIREAEVERYFRDAKITQIYEGTSQIQKLVIAREVLK